MALEIDRICSKIHATRGLSSEIARAIGVQPAAIYQWKRVPATRVLKVAAILGMTPEQVRPDIFGAPVRKSAVKQRTGSRPRLSQPLSEC